MSVLAAANPRLHELLLAEVERGLERLRERVEGLAIVGPCSSPSPSGPRAWPTTRTWWAGRSSRRSASSAKPLQDKRVLHVSATAFGGGVSEILYTLIPLMADVGLHTEWHVIYGREEFFNATKLMHNALQGAPTDLSDERLGGVGALQRDERPRAHRGLGLLRGPRPAARSAADARAREGQLVGLALPHRPLDAEPADAGPAAAVLGRLRRLAVPHARLRARRDGRQGPRRPAGDRPAGAEEHGAVARGRVLRLPPVRDRRRPAADLPGLALRPVEGPDGRHRRLPPGQGAAARHAARAGRLDGHRRPRGLGLLQRDGLPRRRRPRHPHPQQLQQRGRDRGQRVPVALRRGGAEVDPRGVRADGQRGDLEGAAVHRRRRRRDPAAGHRRGVGVPRALASRSAPSVRWRSSRTPASASSSGAPARSTCARIS